MRKILISIVIFVVIVIGVLLYKAIDIDKSLTLPSSQKIISFTQHITNTTNTTSLDHIVVLLMENKSYNEVVRSTNAPYLNSLIHRYSFADNYYAVSHPSLPNYIVLIGGSTFGITSDCTDCYVHASNLVDQLEQSHKTWKAYMESMPSSCFIGSFGEYAQKHDPFIYFDNIRTNPKRCANIVPFNQLSDDIKSIQSTPNFIFITPNLCNDMHNCSVSTGDTWLANTIPSILNSPAFTKQKSLLVITWDEGEGSGTNQIPTVFIGNAAKQRYVSHTKYTHYSLLRTIEDTWNLPSLTMNTSQSNNMFDMLHISNSNH